jgi:hypothetical protein
MMKTEGDHLREFEDAIRRAVSEATAIGFYRNQSHWMKIAALLDEVAKNARELAHRRAN